MKKQEKFNYSSLGNAKIERDEDNTMLIQNISNSGLDGIAIDINGVKSHQFEFKGLHVQKEKSVNISHMGLDSYGRLKCIAQQSFYYSPKHDGYMFAINSKMLPHRISLVGKIKGEVVFRSEYITPIENSKINWWPLILLGKYVLDHACFSYENTSNSNGTSSSTTKVNWNGINPNNGNGDNLNEYETFDGIKFKADDIFIEYEEKSSDCIPLPKLAQIQITTNNKEFKIFE